MNQALQRQIQVGGWVLIGVFVLSGIWILQSIDQMHRSGKQTDVVTVTGTGKVSAAPDVAVADLAITVERATADEAQKEANQRSNAVVDYLKQAGVDEDDIRTSSYNIFPQYDYIEGRTRIRGYQLTQTLEVKIRDLDKANTILDGVVSAGVNQVNNFRFEIDDPDELKAEARKKAIEDARAKAEQLEDDLGLNLGRVVSFSEDTGGFPPPYFGREAIGIGMGGDTKAVPAPAIPTGQNEVTVTVSITYQIK
jgi:uncharacterized protein